jgi:hypothetical protein
MIQNAPSPVFQTAQALMLPLVSSYMPYQTSIKNEEVKQQEEKEDKSKTYPRKIVISHKS